MKSDLRDRVARKLIDHSMGLAPVDRFDKNWPWVMADALIQELGLRQERGTLRVVRYVSDWEVDE